jgi:hypothetical protein
LVAREARLLEKLEKLKRKAEHGKQRCQEGGLTEGRLRKGHGDCSIGPRAREGKKNVDNPGGGKSL